MSADAVQEPAVVADHNSAACKILQALLKRTQRIHIDIIGRLIEQQHIALLLERHSQLQTVSLTARQHAAFLLLIRTGKIETSQIGARIHVTPAQTYQLIAAAHHLVHALGRIYVLMLLVHIRNLDRLANLKRALINLLQPHNQTEQSSLTGTVRADDPDNAVRRKREIQVIEQQLVAERLLHALSLNHLIAKTRTVGDEYLEFLLFLLDILVDQLIIRVQTGLTLSLTCLRSHTHPLQLTLQSLATL